MFRNRIYYRVKPLLPAQLRLKIRRWYARRKWAETQNVWPILPGSEKQPRDWPGWPEGKQFALVLTHDVESSLGMARCRALMELEQQLGVRSCFNFIPEGPYRVPESLRQELAERGFEIGVQDLHHDGRLYRDRRSFARKARRINEYLASWGAVGFRSGFMFHNLEWLHDLNVLYDSSTFDTDPFEPQPDGAETIFPFWVPRADAQTEGDRGYVELPYTLAQDSTVFLLFQERGPDSWCRKLDWIAEHGGMALVNVHPDYMRFGEDRRSRLAFPAEIYSAFLKRVRERYGNSYWQPLPKEVATRVKSLHRPVCQSYPNPGKALVCQNYRNRGKALNGHATRPKIWIDLDNTPHVPFFEPIVDELKKRGFPLLITARDAFQVCELASKRIPESVKVGRHYGRNRLLKGIGLAYRALQLAPVVIKERPAWSISHGARSQLMLATMLRIPRILLEDYEFCQFPPTMRPTWLMAPESIPDSALNFDATHIRKYPGLKEDVYAWKLKADDGILKDLGIAADDLVITVRPPATEAHYHNPESERLFECLMNRACQAPGAKVVLLPRNKRQAEFIRTRWPGWFEGNRTVIPRGAVDGLNLIWASDLVVSGGGTMNREAAALGVPVYSIFRGTIGAVDRHLNTQGRLTLIESTGDVEAKIKLVKRPRQSILEATSTRTLDAIVDAIQEIIETGPR